MNRATTILGGLVVGVGVICLSLAVADRAAAQDPAQLQAELEKARAVIQTYQAQQAQLQAQLVVLQDEKQKLAAQLAELKAQRPGGAATPAEATRSPGNSAKSKGVAPPKSAARKAPPKAEDVVPKVDGVVTGVSGKDLAEISLGSDDGLRKGHRLEVYRIQGGQGIYVGRIEVMKTTPNKSVCKEIPEFKKRDVQKGDRVVSKL